MKLSKGSVPVSVKLIEIFREIFFKKSEIFPLVSPRTLAAAASLSVGEVFSTMGGKLVSA